MTITALVPALICILGAVVYLAAAKPEAKEMGRLAFACALFVLLLTTAGHTVRLP